jgi:cyclophilin family peptidyl-prolyl cis-trans isomerase
MAKHSILLVLCVCMMFGTEAQLKKSKTKISKKAIITRKVTYVKPPVKPAAFTRIRLTTDSGMMVIRLYDSTPLHRGNFIKLVQEHYFDSLMFHRVIKNFMIQGGDPNSKNAQPDTVLGNGSPGYTIPAEFNTTLFHKKGALAAARGSDEVNPLKASSGSQFYIVEGTKYSDAEMDAMEMQRGIKIPENHRAVYRKLGGTPFLDMNYTVFGELESGIEVVDKIANAAKDGNDRPLQDIRMKMEIIDEGINDEHDAKGRK